MAVTEEEAEEAFQAWKRQTCRLCPHPNGEHRQGHWVLVCTAAGCGCRVSCEED